MILIKWHYTLFTKWYISCIVSYNSSRTSKFEYLIIFLNLYTPRIWTQPYVYHNIREYQVRGLFFLFVFLFSHLVMPFFFFFLYFCFLTLCYDNNSKFINCDRFAKTSQVLSWFMTKLINCHCVMGLISIVADPWRYLKTLRKFRQKSSQIKWFLVVICNHITFNILRCI